MKLDRVIDNLGLTYKDEILNTTKTIQIVDKKLIHKKDYCLIYTILVIVNLFLLLVISIICYYHLQNIY